MKYPLIILGAGASHDSLHLEEFSNEDIHKYSPFRPPLANDLFRRKTWSSYIERWDEISDLATDLVGGISRYGGIEPYLTYLLENVVPNNEKRAKQIVATRYYLSTLFKELSQKYYNPGNNYRALLQTIEDECDSKAIFVNFNYDLLLESNIENIKNAKLVDDFISGNIKIVKLHGSCNWVHQPVKQMSFEGHGDNPSSYVYFVVNAKTILEESDIPLNQNLVNQTWDFTHRINQTEVNYFLPAVSIPLTNKKDYICPESHIEIIKQNLDQIDRILLIGWRAHDPYIVELLNNHNFSNKLKLYIVTNSVESAVQVAASFNKDKFDIKPCSSNGFSDFMKSKEYINFWQ